MPTSARFRGYHHTHGGIVGANCVRPCNSLSLAAERLDSSLGEGAYGFYRSSCGIVGDDAHIVPFPRLPQTLRISRPARMYTTRREQAPALRFHTKFG